MEKVLYLLGDAILDNFYWLSHPEHDLTYELTQLGYQVYNCAADGIRVGNIFSGQVVAPHYRNKRKYPYPVDQEGRLRPFHQLAKATHGHSAFQSTYQDSFSTMLNKSKEEIAVLSLGGLDLDSNSVNIAFGKDYFMNTLLTKEFVTGYEKAITTCLAACRKVILVSVYLPYLGTGAKYSSLAGWAKPIIDGWNEFVRSQGQKHNIPVVELSRTFNPYQREHYGSEETKASNLSSKALARCLDHIARHYHGYRVYYAPECGKVKHDY